ncbi:GNAT family N-acetyltransferase [Flavobacterium luminosum]|uniref:GNAT family N-acetyltransferase n=1 Tax=Flavobacterium luminosum TaxID=2949086 RepID=A0ABT0TPZ7_9FLAO|nr:GNAT family N-acetyltransferase [Flavobacterium sp. HXWNR70]MCL9809571.1 GNAT family N-acetyltransferase [Flavobacterium sp. HXWNR70]
MMYLQPTNLRNTTVQLVPLAETDFEDLYACASDPEVWEQHPNKDRYKRDVFEVFFKGALESGGAFKIVALDSDKVVGSTRFYDYNPKDKSVLIGYTFYAKAYWGKGLNPMVKRLMLDYAFRFVDTVYFHVGSQNKRSQIAMERLDAQKIDEQLIEYYGETPKLNFIYEIRKENWEQS